MSYYADVILPLNIQNLLTYSLSEQIHQQCQIGSRVAVPLGKNKLHTAVVVNIHTNKPLHYEAKPVKEVLDHFPIITINQLKLFKWVKNYYLSSFGLILKACLPSALLIQSETLLQLNEEVNYLEQDLSDDEFLLIDAIEKQTQIKMSDAQKILGKTSGLKVVNQLISQNLIHIDRRVKRQYKPKLKTYIRIAEKYKSSENLKQLLDDLGRAEKQKEVVLHYFKLNAKSNKPLSKKDFKSQIDVSDSVLKALIDKAVLEEYSVQEDRIKNNQNTVANKLSLSSAQEKVYQAIKSHFKTSDVVLFKGVTSSGKTEIYLKLIEELLKQQQQILYLLPEIALTTQLIQRIKNQFGKQVLVYHSKYSTNERVEIYKHVLSADSGQIIVGTRSSIFLPFQDLKLIIVDESHENSYKQFDPSPRYHARDTAVVLGQIHQAKVLMGSATPSLESFYNVNTGKFKYVELNKRFGDVKPPVIKTIDLKDKYKRKKMKGHFSDELVERIKETLSRGKQVIVFQNRRGYSPVIECLTCGHSPQCPHCDVSLTLHKANNTLRCHYCGYRMAVQNKCLSCGSQDITAMGFGTEQIEHEAKDLFPKAKIKRMDLDTTRGKYDFEKLIAGFENLEIDILIGTQMLTKGLDFRHVDLVAVMHADGLFNFPNFRAFEKSYQLLTQVAGRAGRTKEQGEVLIQTFQPQHRVIQDVISENYANLYKQEMEQRFDFHYPPYYRMIKLTFKSKDYNRLNEATDWLAVYLKQIFNKHVLGPEFPGIARIRNQYIKHIIIKIPPEQSLSKTKAYLLKGIERYDTISKFRSVRLNIDVDPYT
ncbi:primosomal protein N' [Flavobacterium sp. CS20]|uniref:replication restart helicase PriA n=1 Tax=Flavobacterium sp. CS20 TaxID=2775246 RepID=UPI001B3A0703|nr:primosomal protein N' [Flavobacterium sp. CS20]QTY27521.1 primosomal protein N' [Flavobacterium sp. CS20]